MERYSRQIAYWGKKAQENLKGKKVGVVGVGGVGSIVAEMLVRAGVENVVIVDKDIIAVDNIHRQLYYEDEIQKPKVDVMAERLKRINKNATITSYFSTLTQANIDKILKGCDLVIDCTDNFDSRWLINEFCVANEMPLLYVSAIRNEGMISFFNPPKTGCLACFTQHNALSEMCDVVGVTPTAPNFAGITAVNEALLYIIKGKSNFEGKLFYFNLEKAKFEILPIAKKENCKVCVKKEFSLYSKRQDKIVIKEICGRNAYEVVLQKPIDFNAIIDFLRKKGSVEKKKFFVKVKIGGGEITFFKDGRIISSDVEKELLENLVNEILVVMDG